MTNKHTGSCHCGAVRFEVDLEAPPKGASRCNCSICARVAQTSAIVKPTAFTLLTSEGALSSYEWGGKTAKRFFCTTCGIHAFARGYLEQVGGDYVSVNLNCVDDLDVSRLEVVHQSSSRARWDSHAASAP